VHLHSLDLQVRQAGGGLVGGGGVTQRDAELVVALAGRDLRVRVGVDVGVDPDRHGGLHAELARDMVDARQLRLALNMEREDPVAQRQLDLGLGLAHAGEDAGPDVATRGEHATDLAAAHQVEARAEVREVTQHREARVGLHRVTEAGVQSREPALQAAEIILHRRGAVDVSRRPVEAGDGREVDRLAMESGARVVEVVHDGEEG